MTQKHTSSWRYCALLTRAEARWLMREYKATTDEIAEHYGIAESTVWNMLVHLDRPAQRKRRALAESEKSL
jgi:DNA-binding CsgD family transcriptional regulator